MTLENLDGIVIFDLPLKLNHFPVWLSVLKAFHIIGFVVWFAGLFYWVRLLVYHAEVRQKPDQERAILHSQYSLMEQRLYRIIIWPGLLITVGFGIGLIVMNPAYLDRWLYIKLGFIAVLIGYQFVTARMMNNLQAGQSQRTPYQLRLWNEGATLLLVAIVFLAVLKQEVNGYYLLFGLAGLVVLLSLGVKGYRWYRKRD